MKHILFTIIASLIGISNASAETLQGKSSSWQVPAYKEGYQYTVAASRNYTVTKYLNAAASGRPVKFTASCEGGALGEASRFYDITQKNKVQGLSFNFTFTSVKCPSGKISFEITHPGVEVNSESMDVSILQIAETIDTKFNSIADQRKNTKQTELINISSLLSNTAGSREALHCLIDSYADDILLKDGIVAELILQYSKLYGPYVRTAIKCPVAAQGILASNAATCKADPLDLSIFCIIYARYVATKTWYENSIKTLEDFTDQLDANTQHLADDIEQLKKDMESDLEATEASLKN